MRTWLKNSLKDDPELFGLGVKNVYQGSSITKAPGREETPFLIYRLGNDTAVDMADEDRFPRRQFFAVYVHDVDADYTRIDDICRRLRAWATEVPPQPDIKLLQVNYLETSRDLDDMAFNTIFRYVRLQAVFSE